ncbi:MAG: DEAD/DEAH box helicase family protein [Ignavibacteriaceae bacterium]
MATPTNIGTRELPLKFAAKVSEQANAEFINFQFSTATPITNELLRFWFSDAFSELREFNFHLGQEQAILNTIYMHEVLKVNNVTDMYAKCGKDILDDEGFLFEIQKPKYQHPKYCMKMATGTGKTWVMHALLIWQYLNAKYEETKNGRYTKNFLLVAPGLIVYERLLDAYLGKQSESGYRNFSTSDMKVFEKLFIPDSFREEVFGFIQSSICQKEEIGRKVTAEGMIAITNWHLLAGSEEEESEEDPGFLENVPQNINELLPISPGTSAGHSLDALDSNFLAGAELEYLASINDLAVFNDEAHHIHDNKTYGEIKEVEWQKSLNYISQPKGTKFIQIDFSATPYDVTGSGQKRTKHYFPHTIVDFDLATAIRHGLVKTIALDKRKEIAAMDLDFKAERDGNKAVSLSEGQRVMLRAGLTKLKLLESKFVQIKDEKYPKMFVICEDTSVSPLVIQFLLQEGFGEDDVMQIDSDRKGNIPTKEWSQIKQRLFNVDKHGQPKVIVSVLMLREGFDVNNICVIVPLRSAQAPILLEQTIGRGLRLMWREPEFKDIKDESRKQLLLEKKEPDSLMDILHIVEHPKFVEFYDELMKENLAGTTEGTGGGVTGDIITVSLKENYKDYDLFWPTIVRDSEEELREVIIDVEKIKPFTIYTIEQLEMFINREGDVFFSEEMTVKTRFGEYVVKGDLFDAKSYNEYLSRVVNIITNAIVNIGVRKQKAFPFLQVNHVELVRAIDFFIRHKLFSQDFNPLVNNNWKLLLIAKSGIIDHMMKELGEAIYNAQQNISVTEAVVIKSYFSDVETLRMREKYCLPLEKTIYEVQSYPSNKGGLEKAFMEYVDAQTDTISFIKINEYYHDFAKIFYVREDGLLAPYSPDFIVQTASGIYIVETKAQTNLSQGNVKQKQRATIDFIERVNKLNPENRMGKEWSYALLGENTFYSFKERGATPTEMFEYVKINRNEVLGTLF